MKLFRYSLAQNSLPFPFESVEGEGVFDIELDFACKQFDEWVTQWESRFRKRRILRGALDIYQQYKKLQTELIQAQGTNLEILEYSDSVLGSVGRPFIFPSLHEEKLIKIRCKLCERDYDSSEVSIKDRIVRSGGSEKVIICPKNHILYAQSESVIG